MRVYVGIEMVYRMLGLQLYTGDFEQSFTKENHCVTAPSLFQKLAFSAAGNIEFFKFRAQLYFRDVEPNTRNEVRSIEEDPWVQILHRRCNFFLLYSTSLIIPPECSAHEQ